MNGNWRRNPFLAPAALWLCAVLLAACAPSTAPTPPVLPTPQTVRIQYPADLRPLLPALRTCLTDYPQLAPQMEERSPTRLEISAADLTLWWGESPPESGFAYLLGYDSLRVVVSAQREGREPTPFEVAALYRGDAPPEGASAPLPSLKVWTYPAEHPFRAQFETVLLSGGRTTTNAQLAPHSQAMQSALAEDPAALGFLPALWLTDTLRPLEIGMPLQPILALSPQEPQGALRNLLACWQGSLSETLTPP